MQLFLHFESGFSAVSRMIQRDLHLEKYLSLVVLRFSFSKIWISVTFIYDLKESLFLPPSSSVI